MLTFNLKYEIISKMKNEIFIKIYNVIHSCIDRRQLFYALRYLDQAEKGGFIDPEFRQSIYLNIYLDKKREIINAGVVERDTHMP